MSLSLHDRRVLADIERQVNEHNPDLVSLLATFGKSSPRVRAMAALRPHVDLIVKYVVLVTGMALLVAAVALHSAPLLAAAVGVALAFGLLRLVLRCGQRRHALRVDR
ncbi:DUF3040 domain-containing protein [Streptomyces sp. RPT161]|uniref:DUF3040 domain-containing protein n=1 Tax=Streptomyces sp. RPT161 TaxID=3015993 RepID=UPI0022B8F210|nr:DUF3040 domain-containing protein [Streptomyces sp. RPT161]